MIKLKKIIFSVLFLLFSNLAFLATNISAQENTVKNFTTSIETTYNVNRNGNTIVSHHIRITNNTPAIYIKQYALKTSYFGLQNIVVKYKQQEIPANIVSNEDGTSIGITFEDSIVGQGKIRDFYIEYSNPDLATVAGNVLEVHIPQLGDNSSFNTNKTILITPVYFSLPVRVTPSPISTDFVKTEVKTVFERPNGEPISAIFGTEQNYKMVLRYNLENPTSNPAIAQITLPPDTQFQKMHYYNLDPFPYEMKTDIDGNWIASYKIPASSVTVVNLTAETKITLEPNSVPTLPIKPAYTQSDKYWEKDNKLIKQKAQEFTTAKEIYDHIVATLSYSRKEINLDDLTRYGAVDAFKHSDDAVCQEFTDTFIAIARAANIPSRRLVGYGYSQNSVLRPSSFAGDVLHSWPEYFDKEKNLWIPIDPTWSNTTGGIDYFNLFDLNHIVFAINGSSSTSPNPAGSYKLLNDEQSKDVDIEISNTIFPVINPEILTEIKQKKFFFMPIPGMYTIYVTNKTGQAWYDIQPQIIALDNNIDVSFGEENNIKVLLPFQTKKIDITLFTNSLSLPKQSEITLNYSWQNTGEIINEPTTKQITSGPKAIIAFRKKETYLYLGSGFVIITLITGSILVYKPKISSFIRRQSKKTEEPS